MEDWGAVKARLTKVLAESAEVVNILPDRTTQWDISDDIRAALERVEELEREALSSAPPYYRKWEEATRERDEARAEVANLSERWACVKCGCTPDGGKSGDLYVSICHGCHRCNECAEPMCTICGDAEGTRMRAGDLLAEVERLREALGRVLTEAGLQAHKHGCANKIARPAQWDARLPCAGCQAESALQGGE